MESSPGSTQAASSEKPGESVPGSRWFVANLVLILGTGVAVLYWIGYHTELLGIVGGILGLGGAFAWVAFIFGLIRDERKKQLQLSLDARLNRGSTAFVGLLVTIVAAFSAGLFGSLRIDARRDTTDRFIEIRRTGSDSKSPLHADVLPGRAVRKFPVYVGWGRREYTVRVDGLPEITLQAARYRRRTLVSPEGLKRRNVILIRPDTEVSQTARKTPLSLTIRIGNDTPRVLEGYRGASVWVGCDRSVAIPTALRERWRLELVASKIPEARMLPWLSPTAVAEKRILLRGDPIRLALGQPGEIPWLESAAVVEDCGRPDCFPQEVILQAPPLSTDGGDP